MSSSLDFIIKLTDRVTAPLKRVQLQLKSFNATASSSFKKIGGGGLALFAVAKSITSILSPAEEMDRALTNASIGGVSCINELRKAARKFSADYGTSAVDFVNSASSIKGALSGISEHDVPQATAAMNLLSKATGDSVETSISYIEQMMSNYKNTANKMGQLNFAKNVAGIAAYTKSNFNISTQQLQNLMLKTKGTAANNNVSMSEQAVVLSMASKSIGGSAAGSYEAFYKNLSVAGKELGLSFSDATGKMLSMPEIITKIQGKFGKDISKNIKAQQMLDKAFGSGANIVKVLSNNSNELNQHMKDIGNGKSLVLMKKMAEGNIKPLERINAQFTNIKESIGRALLPVLKPGIDTITSLINKFAQWMEMFPNIAKWLGIITIALIGLTAVAAIFAIISGVISILLSPITLIILAIGAVIAVCWVFRKQIGDAINWVITKFQELWDKIKDTWVIKLLIGQFKFLGKVFSVVWKGIKAAFKLWISYLVWLKGMFISAFTYISKLITSFWESLKNTWLISSLIAAFNFLFDLICSGWDLVCTSFNDLVEWISDIWDEFINYFTDFSFIESFNVIGDSLVSMFKRSWKIIKNMGISMINSIIEKLNYIPGVNIELVEYEQLDELQKKPISTDKSPITSTVVSSISPGGLSKEIKNNQSQHIDNSKNIQSVTINNSQPMTPGQLQEWQEVYSG